MDMQPRRTIRERHHPRVEAGFMVKILLNGKSVVAKAKDLSMAGLCLLGHHAGLTDEVTVTIPLPGDREVVARGSIKRTLGQVIAVEFKHLDWDDMFALARFLHPRLP